MTAPRGSTTGRLARLGFEDTAAARRHLESPALAGVAEPEQDESGLLGGLSATADPDLALLGLTRFLEAAQGADAPDVREVLTREGPRRARLLGVLGSSAALGDHLALHPDQWVEAADARPLDVAERTRALVAAVSPEARGPRTGEDALRVAYRGQLLGIAALDVTSEDPRAVLDETAAALADLASATLQAALVLAAEEHPEEARRTRLAVIAMGKTGGRELNYVSDVDVVFAAEPAPGVGEEEAIAAATRLATSLVRICSAQTGEGTIWPVDAALRPEGKQGPLVRTVASHGAYYRRWAKTWEFQALLKARFVAGDADVGRAYLDTVCEFVWDAASRDHFVEDVQAMRRRVEEHVPTQEADRQLKLGAGGLRDVEFAVQLLQLVHGRSDPTLRSRTTLKALDALAAGGYVAREDAATFEAAYRLLRTLEHRIQLVRLRRTHLMPRADADLRRLGRALGLRTDPVTGLLDAWRECKREVRRVHERLFYRPLLSAIARLSSDEARLTPDEAKARLHALGFLDPAGALRHLEALTSGTTRAAAIQRTLLPAMLGWFADQADPDAGLLAFRRLSDSLGATHWYLKMLRDEGRAAEQLAHVLAGSRYATDLLMAAPESVRMLASADRLRPRERDALASTMAAAMGRKDDADEAITAVRVIRRQELFRIALADLTGALEPDDVRAALTDLTQAYLSAALHVASTKVARAREREVAADLALIGMGRLGGAECGYGSDADVMAVHRARPGASEQEATADAADVLQELRRLVGAAGPDPALAVDLDLRPEGKAGPLSRTLDGYAAYYRRWSGAWEAQALLRARPVAGDAGLGEEFERLVDPLRRPADGLDARSRREIRRLKARMESERLPRGADPKRHVKLGRGGLSDVEWTVQLLQLEHARDVPGLRTTRTLPALHAARDAGLVTAADATSLEEAWRLASDLRDAMVLWRGRNTDSVPADLRDAEGASRILGGAPGDGALLEEHYLRTARRARRVTERVFYGAEDDGPRR